MGHIENICGNFLSNITRRKAVDKSIQQSDATKSLRWHTLLAYGIAATVGGGIYVTVGNVARDYTGPSVVISTFGAGFLSLLTAFCYLELAAMVPATGSSYIYGYSYLGEIFGFIFAWLATLEYAFAASVTGIGWTEYFVTLLQNAGVDVPVWIYGKKVIPDSDIIVINLLAFTVIVLVSIIVLQGLHFGTRFNNVLTSVNILVILFIIIAGFANINAANYSPFLKGGFSGVFTGAATMIYSYIGFDTICNLSSDAVTTKHLQTAVIGTVAIATTLYVLVGFVLTGMIPSADIPEQASLSAAFVEVGLKWGSYIVQACALSMTSATLLACLIGQPRIFEMMAKDGLLPSIFYKKFGKSNLPFINIVISCSLSAVLALFININYLVDLISAGALLGFSGSAAALIVARLDQKKEVKLTGIVILLWLFFGSAFSWPILHRGEFVPFLIVMGPMIIMPYVSLCLLFYKHYDELGKTNYADNTISTLCPFMPIIPASSIVGNISVTTSLPPKTFYFLAAWLVIGLIIYFGYSYRNTKIDSHTTELMEYGSPLIKPIGAIDEDSMIKKDAEYADK